MIRSKPAERAAAPWAGCPEGSIFLSARVCIIWTAAGNIPLYYTMNLRQNSVSHKRGMTHYFDTYTKRMDKSGDYSSLLDRIMTNRNTAAATQITADEVKARL